MNEASRDQGLRWIAQAGHDLDAARDLLAASRFNVTCFLAQQAAEKAVKGFLIARGAEEPWGHSVARLLEDAGTYDASHAALIDTGKWLDKFYIPTRYPSGLPCGIPATAYTEIEARNALDWAGAILAAMKRTT